MLGAAFFIASKKKSFNKKRKNNEIGSEVGSYPMICFSESLALVSKGLPRGGIGNVAV